MDSCSEGLRGEKHFKSPDPLAVDLHIRVGMESGVEGQFRTVTRVVQINNELDALRSSRDGENEYNNLESDAKQTYATLAKNLQLRCCPLSQRALAIDEGLAPRNRDGQRLERLVRETENRHGQKTS